MIGERLAELRRDKGISKEELAQVLSLSHYTIASYEQNKSDPDDEIKIKIATFFNVSLDYLLGLSDTELSLNREYDFSLPPHFPIEAKHEMSSFLDYLKFKYRPKK